MSEEKLEDKINRHVNYMFPDDPKLCIVMKRIFKLLTDEIDRLAASIAAKGVDR